MKTILAQGKFLALIKEGHWEYAARVNATGAAIIVAATDDRKIILVEQYRIPVHARTIELPAGVVGDEPGCSAEDQAEGARRELLEETGFAADGMEFLMLGAASSGVTSELITLFRASGLRRVHAGGGVADEEITVHEVPLAEADDWLKRKAKEGALVDPKIYAAIYFLGQSPRNA